MDAEARLGRQVVDPVDAGEEAVLLARRVAQPGEHREDLLGVDDQAGLAVLVVGAEHRARVRVADLAGDQLEADASGISGTAPCRPGRPRPRARCSQRPRDRLARPA